MLPGSLCLTQYHASRPRAPKHVTISLAHSAGPFSLLCRQIWPGRVPALRARLLTTCLPRLWPLGVVKSGRVGPSTTLAGGGDDACPTARHATSARPVRATLRPPGVV